MGQRVTNIFEYSNILVTNIYPITLPSSTPGTLALSFRQMLIHEKRRFSNLPWPTLLLTLSGRPAALSPEQERFPILSRSSSPWSCPWCGPRLLCFPPCHESPFHVKFLYTNIHHTSTLLLLFLTFFWTSCWSQFVLFLIAKLDFHHLHHHFHQVLPHLQCKAIRPAELQQLPQDSCNNPTSPKNLLFGIAKYIHQHHLSTCSMWF